MSRPYYSALLTPEEEREFVPFLLELAALARAVIAPLFLTPLEVHTKGDATPVTAADRGAEQALRARLQARYPDHGVLGEEFGEQAGAGRYRWILDPVDGTKAFVTHCFLFGTLIALERDDGAGFRPVLGCIAHPAAGLTLVGHRGGTTLVTADGTRRATGVRAARPLEEATVLLTTLPGSLEQGGAPGVDAVVRRARLARTWGDCFGYFALATGGADVMLDPVLSYWDVAAVVPVVEGAGGRVSAWDGGDPLRGLSLVATSGGLHEEVLGILHKGK